MDKNYNTNMDCKRMMAEFTEAFGDAAVEMTFREVVKGMDSFFGLMGMTIELVNLIRKEEELKKHHRAYLHVRAEIEKRADAAMEFIAGIVDDLNAKEHFYHVSADSAFPFAEAEDEDEAITIPKDKYDLMIEDLLTMAELLDMVADMRTKDVRTIQEFGKYVPAFAAFEKNRLRHYLHDEDDEQDVLPNPRAFLQARGVKDGTYLSFRQFRATSPEWCRPL